LCFAITPVSFLSFPSFLSCYPLFLFFLIGCVNINEIGTTSLLLLRSEPNAEIGQPRTKEERNKFIVLNVEVKFSAAEEDSAMTIIVWEAKLWKDPLTEKVFREGNVNFSIKNSTNFPIVIHQRKVNVAERLSKFNRPTITQSVEEDANRWFFVSPADSWLPFGYIDPEGEQEFDFACVSNDGLINPASSVRLVMAKIGKSVILTTTDRQRIKIQLKSNANGKVISIHYDDGLSNSLTKPASVKGDQLSNSPKSEEDGGFIDTERNEFCVSFAASISLSIIPDKPTRRELFALYLKNLFFEMRHLDETKYDNAVTLISFKLQDIQLDNYSETCIYPVLLRSERNWKEDNELEKDPNKSMSFIESSVVIDYPKDQSSSIIKYAAFRMLEIHASIDSASILIVASDLLSFVSDFTSVDYGSMGGNSNSSSSKDSHLQTIASVYNETLMKHIHSNKLYNIDYQYKYSQTPVYFIESLTIHPMKLTLSFYPSHFPRKTTDIPAPLRFMTKVEVVTSVEDFQVKIKSFIAENAMDSLPKLMERFSNKIIRDLQTHLVQIAGNLIGSLNLLGNPAGLYKHIGSSVENFFYEVSALIVFGFWRVSYSFSLLLCWFSLF
jgi:hypothetical protein